MRAKIIGLRNIRSGTGWADSWPALLFTNFVTGRSFFLILKCGCLAGSISLERREYAWTRKEVVIMWQKLTSCRLGSENLENRDPLRGHTITSGMLLSSGGPVKSDAFFL